MMGHAGTTDCHVPFQNLTGGKLDLVYRKIADDFPAAWWVSFCDNYDCFATFVARDTFAPIKDSGYAEFKVSVTPNGKADTSTVKYEIYNASTPNVKDTVTFVFMVQWGAGLHEAMNPNFQVYPNPAADVIHLNGIQSPTQVHIYSTEGREVLSATVSNENSINIASLPKGFFFVSYVNENGLVRGSFVKQ